MPEEAPTGDEEVMEDMSKRGPDMIFAARQGDVDTVRDLLGSGVPIGFKDPSGWTALRWSASEGQEDVLALLVDHGAHEDEVEAVGDAPAAEGGGGGSSLHWAAYKGHTRLVWRLLTCKPKLNPKALDTESNTPLHLAAASGHLLILETLLSQGVDVSIKNAYGNTASTLSTSSECQQLLKEAGKAALDGRPYLCSCSKEFCSEAGSAGEEVIDKVSAPTPRPVRYSSQCLLEIRAAEDGLSKAHEVETLDAAITRAQAIGASLPKITDAIAKLERMRAEIALDAAVQALQAQRPLQDRSLTRPMLAPLKQARDKGVAEETISEAKTLVDTAEAEAEVLAAIAECEPYKMVPVGEEEGGEEPPASDSDFAKRAAKLVMNLTEKIHAAQSAEAMPEVIDSAELKNAFYMAEADLRKALAPPTEGFTEDGTPCQTQHNGSKTYSQLEDLTFRNDFLDASLEKCLACGTAEPFVLHAAKVQKDLKVLLRQAQIEDEERKAKEAAAAAKAAKKGKKKK